MDSAGSWCCHNNCCTCSCFNKFPQKQFSETDSKNSLELELELTERMLARSIQTNKERLLRSGEYLLRKSPSISTFTLLWFHSHGLA